MVHKREKDTDISISVTGEPLERKCAWCNRTYVNGRWLFVRREIPPERITHGICGKCKSTFKR